MESLVLTVKFVIFSSFEVFVVATAGAALIAGLVQLVRGRARRTDVIAPAAIQES